MTNRLVKNIVYPTLALTLLASLIYAKAADSDDRQVPGKIWLIEIEGAIGPATSDYVLRGFELAQDASASLIVLRMNTPGGLDNAMRDIIKGILASPVPVVSYVSPKGARAASAGTYISYASHFAAMSPATNLGAATPVQIGGPSSPLPTPPTPGDDKSDEKNNGKGEQDKTPQATAMERKMVNDASAYIIGLAELRGRNATWAEQAVRDAASIDANTALEIGVVDIIAEDLADLYQQLDGREVTTNAGSFPLALKDRDTHIHAPDWRTEILSVLTNPGMVLVLGMIGIYGIILEFYNPGSLVPGVVGIICLLLAAYSVQLLPLNYAGLALLLLGISLMVAEALVPSFGIMGVGGIVAFSIGGLMLFDTELDAFQIGWPLILSIGVMSAALIIITARLALKIRVKRVSTGVTALIGQAGTALIAFSQEGQQEGQVRLGGEIWRAVSADRIEPGDRVSVVSVDGLQLTVEKH